MSTEKFFKLMAYIKEAKSIASSMTLAPDCRPNAQKLHLLGLLDRIQHLVVSLRADFIDLFYFRSPYEEGTPPLAEPGEPAAMPPHEHSPERVSNIVPFNRRRAKEDRRRMHTFIARDRRSGIADRRRKRHDRRSPAEASAVRR
jgi:hypothetical protein